MARRDYWSRPIQSDRLLHDYGNTRLTPECRAQLRRDLWLVPLLPVGALIFWMLWTVLP
jgi:hypothetical protein